MNSQYVRVKREKTTFFYECDPKDSIESLKIRMKPFLKIESNEMRLYLGKRVKYYNNLGKKEGKNFFNKKSC